MANQTTSIDYKHPYATILWQHKPTGGEWQDAINLSGYVGGQGTKTLELSGATEAETGHLRCALTNPAGAIRLSELAALSATASAPEITVGISDETPYQGNSATYGPITVTGSPTPDLLWEAETADGNNTWADADTVFGADGSGQGTDTYIVANTEPGDNRDVRVTATNTQGSAASQAALTVTPTLAVTGPEPTDKTITATPSGPAEYFKDFATDMTLGGWTHTRNSLATAPNAAGTIITYQANEPAWYKDQGLQLEDESTNLQKESSGMTNWQSSEMTLANDGVAGPLGAATWSCTPSAASAWHYFNNNYIGTADILQSHSIVVKRNGYDFFHTCGSSGYTSDTWLNTSLIDGTAQFNTSVGGPDPLPSENLGNDWWKIAWTVTPIAGGSERMLLMSTDAAYDERLITFTGDGSSGLLFSHYQVEESPFPTSYIPTSGATYTRAGTTCAATFAELGDPLPAEGLTDNCCGQLVFTIPTSTADMTVGSTFMSIQSTPDAPGQSAGNRIVLGLSFHASPQMRCGLRENNVHVANRDFGIQAAGTYDFRFKYANGSLTAWLNSSPVGSAINGAGMAVAMTQVRIGHWTSSGPVIELANLNCHKIRLVPEALNDEDILAWT